MDKRQGIISAAIAVFSEKGVAKATVADIVARAGIAQGTFYLYFPSKLEVMGGIAEHLVARMLTHLQQRLDGLPVADRLDGLPAALFEVVGQNRELATLLYAGMAQSPQMRRWEQIYQPIYAWLEDSLVQAGEQGLVRAGMEPALCARIVLGTVEAAAEQVHLYADTDRQQAAAHRRELETFLHHALGRARVLDTEVR